MLIQTQIIETIKSFGPEEFTKKDVIDRLPEGVNPNSVSSVLSKWQNGELYKHGWKETRRAMGSRVTLHKVPGTHRYYLLGLNKPNKPPVEAVPEVADVPVVLEYTIKTILVDQLGREWVLKED